MRNPVPACDRLEQALARILDPSGEGSRTFLSLYRESAEQAATAADRRSRDGTTLGPLDGAIVSIKDLFDVAGERTRAGSIALDDALPAREDAPIVRGLRDAGAIIIGKTNMSEFAFTGVGANPHYGTPGNPADRSRVPGGSSSGAAVAVADGMCEISIGTDTGGSTRIPAALCGVVGYKPTKERISTRGAFPLSPTLDSVGPLGHSVEACALADSVLAGERPWDLERPTLQELKLAVPQGPVLEDLDEVVAPRFESSIGLISRAGARIVDLELPVLERMNDVQSVATIATVEAYRIHHRRIAERGSDYDPIVRSRIETGSAVSTDAFLGMLKARSELVAAMDLALVGVDALIYPTTPIVAPTFEDISATKGFNANNRLLLRNTAIANFFDLCAISLPMRGPGALPAGLMIVGRHGTDRQLFRIAAAIEMLLSG
ncbi:MAG TPA: amidase [Sphingomicrobium sp.]|nr:amidase [Sphingomicrobium sp.]